MNIKTRLYLVVACLLFTSMAHAGSFSERFKDWVLGAEANASIHESPRVELDAVSAGCMGCHGGKGSHAIVVKSADAPMQYTASGHQSNHPVGMNYARFAQHQPGSYRPQAALSASIRLVDGQVGCVSCHTLKTDSETGSVNPVNARQQPSNQLATQSVAQQCTSGRRLTVGPRKTDLCMSCHAM